MAFKVVDCDNVRETFTGAGSATITLGGAAQYSRAMSAVLSNGDTFWGVARAGAEFSVGIFTYTSSGGTVAQTTVFYSSNSNNAVTFSSGAAGEIFIDAPARIFDELNLGEITVASASTCDIGAVHGGKIVISGTTTITSLGTSANKRRLVRFSGALVLTHNATSLILPGAANITTADGDTALFASDSSGNWRCYFYQRPTSAGREVLTSARSYYVRSDGSNSNNGLANTAGGAFATIQKAIDVVSGNLDIGVQTVTINVADATYTDALTLKRVIGAGTVNIVGNTSTPANCVISVTSAAAITCKCPQYDMRGFKTVTTTAGDHFNLGAGCDLIIREWNFGAAPTGWSHILASDNAKIQCAANYTISGAASVHWYTDFGGLISSPNRTITISGTPAFATAFAQAVRTGAMLVPGCTFSGSATGTRYIVNLNGLIDTFGAGGTYLPGNAAGSSATGGQYA